MTHMVEQSKPSATKTAGAIKAGNGRYTFDLARLQTIDAGPGYSSAHGPVVEGERIQVGLMRMPRGTGGRPHSHPNEQWVYVIQGTLETEVDGIKSRATPGSLIYMPANVEAATMIHSQGLRGACPSCPGWDTPGAGGEGGWRAGGGVGGAGGSPKPGSFKGGRPPADV
jgi:quercetin dioxygenase-like cupin family protein